MNERLPEIKNTALSDKELTAQWDAIGGCPMKIYQAQIGVCFGRFNERFICKTLHWAAS
jgi:hypothetical protein